MIERGHAVKVFLGGTGPVTEQLRGVPAQSLKYLRRAIHPWRDLRALAELTAALREWRPDLVSTHTAKAGWIGRAAAARLRLPAIYTPHGWPIGDRISRAHGAVFTLAERAAQRWARAIICVSESERRLALRVAPPDKLHVVYNGVRDTPHRARPASGERIITIARFEEPKDHRTLLAALPDGAELDLVGDGPLEPAIRALAPARVRFHGYQPDPAELLAQAHVFVLSSRSEGFPRSILEAMRAGLPVVASDVGGVSEAVTHGINGFLVPRGDAAALRTALRQLLENQTLRERFGAAARQSYESRFTLERMVGDTLAVYGNVIREAS
jgi:glycosyltransferase involved in cell wall biosynthesis